MATFGSAEVIKIVYERSTTEDEGEKEEIQMPKPPTDWTFNGLLVQVASKMSAEDLERAKTMFKGEDGLRRHLLSKIEKPLELFDNLQKHTFLDRNNFLYLQALLYQIGRMDLYDIAIKYAQNLGDVIYFSSPPKEPADGYGYIQFHIEGKDFSKVKRSSLEAIRMTAARLMIVPPQFVTIAGIEPSSSLLVTIMVPERFIKYLKVALDKKPAIKELTHLGIDTVRISDKVVNIHGIEGADIIATEEQTTLSTLYAQLQDTRQKLKERDIELQLLNTKLEEKDTLHRNMIPKIPLIESFSRARTAC